MNLVEQNFNGSIYAIAYQDNGYYHISVVNEKGEELDNLDINKMIVIDPDSLPITGFMEPLITCSFLEDDSLFVSCYHRMQKKQYHFMYSYKEKKMLSDPIMTKIMDKKCT